jgi:hypothetical protein
MLTIMRFSILLISGCPTPKGRLVQALPQEQIFGGGETPSAWPPLVITIITVWPMLERCLRRGCAYNEVEFAAGMGQGFAGRLTEAGCAGLHDVFSAGKTNGGDKGRAWMWAQKA